MNKTEISKLALEFFHKQLDHIFGCDNEDCESYWDTVQFLSKNKISTKPSEIRELIKQVKELLN